MAAPAAVEPVQVFAALLWREPEAVEEALRALGQALGELDYRGPARPFHFSDYYRQEMGEGLQRSLSSFTPLRPPEALVEIKLAAARIEDALRGPTGRRVNIDPGYLDLHKVVLASLKQGPMKVYLGKGVHADLIARYTGGRFQALPWTFQDFREGAYDEDLLRIRGLYKAKLRPPG